MKLRRGCGCPILILGIFNLLMVVASILSLARGSTSSVMGSSATKLGAVLFLLVFSGNVLVCAVIGIVAFRGGLNGSNTGEQATGEASSADEGTEDIDSEEP